MIKETISTSRGNLHLRKLSGLAEAVDIMKAVRDRGKTYLGEESLKIRNNDWAGTRDVDEAINLAQFGWPEGRKKFREISRRLKIDKLVGNRAGFATFYDVSGDEPDVDSYLAGAPENMINYDILYEPGGKIANLWVNTAVLSDVSPERIIRRGAAILAAHSALTAEGYSLGIEMTPTSEFDRKWDNFIEHHIPVVIPGGYVNEDVLAFCFSSPAFFRRLIFALRESEDDALRKEIGAYSRGVYGHSCRLVSDIPPQTFVIDQGEGLDCYNDEETLNFAQNIVDRALKMLQ